MLNIIVYQHHILVETYHDKLDLPQTTSIQQLLPNLKLVHQSNDYYVTTIEDGQIFQNHLDGPLHFINLRQAMNILPYKLMKTIIYFQQLHYYYLTHQYCGKCGTPTIKRELNKFVFCPKCCEENYPHIAPCIIVRIHRNDKILMARGINFPPAAWGLIAGFIEVGESLEEGIIREVHEEVGIEIKDICYWGSEPWPYPGNSLMIGYTATYKSGELVLDHSEIEAAGFYAANELPGVPSTTFSIASRMIKEFKASSNS